MTKWFKKAGDGKKDGGGMGEGEEEEEEEEDEDEWETDSEDPPLDEHAPSYEFRFACAKLLIELDEETGDAIHILEDLLRENDMDPNVWHLLSLAYYSGE
jgi:hypothetical protein